MTIISPLLQNRLNATNNGKQTPNNRHEKIYQDLQKRAHEAKPNEAKAKLVKEGILGNPITATKDIIKDGKNFFKATTTGNMGDNNLGRINDLGLKVGASLIATFLALHSKTKTQSIMRFVGGATFIAMMDLWPKLFINLPARLVHGFRIDRKYISAQGDKKDFFLDNQFLVWDAYPEKQLRKDAKKAGIDYDSENGKEKIQRKMQKTALQNRTLWMATAGFATPLLTAMTGNFIEPLVEKAVVDHDVKKVQKILASENGLAEYLANVSKNAKASKGELKALDSLFNAYKTGEITQKVLFEKLADKFSLQSLAETFKDSDDMSLLDKYHPANLVATLEKMYEANRETLNKNNIISLINQKLVVEGVETLKAEEAKEILNALGNDFSEANVKTVLQNYMSDSSIKEIFADLKVDEDKFFESIKTYYSTTFTQLKARVKGYMQLINPIVGSKAESLQTLEFNKTMREILKTLEIDPSEVEKITKTLKVGDESASDITAKIFKLLSGKIAGLNDTKRDELMKLLSSKDFDEKTSGLIEKLLNNTDLLQGDSKDPLTRAILGIWEKTEKASNVGNKDGLASVFKKFIDKKSTDIKAIKSKLIIIANLEERIKNGEFNDEEIKIARKYVYDGGISTIISPIRKDTVNPKKFLDALNKVFDPDQFEDDDIKAIIKNIRKIGSSDISAVTPTIDYMSCGSFAEHLKKFATSLGNNKAWMKIFAPMTIALVAITLLAQPFFGKIDKEFQQEGKNGGAK